MQNDLEAASGRQAAMVRVRGYNGGANDDRVEVAVYTGTLWPAQTAGPAPAWNGEDRWHIPSNFLALELDPAGTSGDAASRTPRFQDSQAYVTGSVFVARLESLWVGGVVGAPAMLTENLITGRLLRDGDLWSIPEGIFAGRRELTDALNAWALAGTSTAEGKPCSETAAFATARQVLCPVADVRADGVADPTLPCDALSGGLAFEALPAKLGDVIELPPATMPCEPDATGCEDMP
jgi:hypothetical protein